MQVLTYPQGKHILLVDLIFEGKEMSMPIDVRVNYSGDAAEAINRICRITRRSRREEVFADMANTYLWILHQQSLDRCIVSEDQDPRKTTELANFVEDKQEALKYF